jgi:hypothetical protein
VVIGAHDEQQVLRRDDEHEGPEDEGDYAEHGFAPVTRTGASPVVEDWDRGATFRGSGGGAVGGGAVGGTSGGSPPASRSGGSPAYAAPAYSAPTYGSGSSGGGSRAPKPIGPDSLKPFAAGATDVHEPFAADAVRPAGAPAAGSAAIGLAPPPAAAPGKSRAQQQRDDDLRTAQTGSLAALAGGAGQDNPFEDNPFE